MDSKQQLPLEGKKRRERVKIQEFRERFLASEASNEVTSVDRAFQGRRKEKSVQNLELFEKFGEEYRSMLRDSGDSASRFKRSEAIRAWARLENSEIDMNYVLESTIADFRFRREVMHEFFVPALPNAGTYLSGRYDSDLGQIDPYWLVFAKTGKPCKFEGTKRFSKPEAQKVKQAPVQPPETMRHPHDRVQLDLSVREAYLLMTLVQQEFPPGGGAWSRVVRHISSQIFVEERDEVE